MTIYFSRVGGGWFSEGRLMVDYNDVLNALRDLELQTRAMTPNKLTERELKIAANAISSVRETLEATRAKVDI